MKASVSDKMINFTIISKSKFNILIIFYLLNVKSISAQVYINPPIRPCYVIYPYQVSQGTASNANGNFYVNKIDYQKVLGSLPLYSDVFVHIDDKDLKIRITNGGGTPFYEKYATKDTTSTEAGWHRFRNRDRINGMWLDVSARNKLSDSTIPPLGTIELCYDLGLTFPVDSGRLVSQVDTAFNRTTSEFKNQFNNYIQRFSDAITQNPVNTLIRVTINGHASNLYGGIGSATAYNLRLAADRTAAGINFFVRKYTEVTGRPFDVQASVNPDNTINRTGIDSGRISGNSMGITNQDRNGGLTNIDQSVRFIFY